ncbi:hypothetical protein [Peribacillus loiseleuriae]|uniref:Uncharacterized protein n=1 Tax=Peribacillus loiseleuriae TaxID=1679170 RepID=A0A0K9GQ70_9BACI|nr:hypothetical protein [Peribacillus loiseleuriae]KMY48736.1 hypothetical protein AC625_03780 [Peribacillus loiseleuriae]
MVEVKSVKIDGENIHVFKSAIYIFVTSTGNTLELNMIVSEVIVKKYKKEENLIIEIELQDGRIIGSIMQLKIWSGTLPQLNLYCELNDLEEYHDFEKVTENESFFPNIEEGITLEEIRKVEMPNEKVTLKLNLPIDQKEWLSKQKNAILNEIFKEMIYEVWRK